MRTLTVLLLVLVSFAIAETVTFQPDATVGKDAWVVTLYSDTNYGTDVTCLYGISSGYFCHTYIEFTELNDSQYQGATVNQAVLWLWIRGAGTEGQYQVGACSSAWDENTITWNNRPSDVFDSHEVDYPTLSGEWLSLDITDYVQNWLDATWENYGLVMFDYYGSDQFATVNASDYTDDPTLRPKLILDYSGAAVEETTWGEIKASF